MESVATQWVKNHVNDCRHGHQDCVRLLLNRGAQLLRTNDQETALDIAVKVGPLIFTSRDTISNHSEPLKVELHEQQNCCNLQQNLISTHVN
jgi:hypothetical protein